MILELPTSRPYGGLFLVGSRRQGGAVQEIGSIVVKASYLLEPVAPASSEHGMSVDTNAAHSQPLLADEPGTGGGDVARECDAAAWKPQNDIVVEGFPDGVGAHETVELGVAGRAWIRRTQALAAPDPADLPERNRHLFGYHPRTVAPRRGQAGDALDGSPVPDPLPDPWEPLLEEPARLGDLDGFENGYANVHRRGGAGFARLAQAGGAFASGERVLVERITTGPSGEEVREDAFAATLSFPSLFALYRTYCGKGPDTPPHWSRRRLGVMRPDTLILAPRDGRAIVLWRAVWPWGDEPIDSYRAVRVSEEEI